jgi:hypothetical protein
MALVDRSYKLAFRKFHTIDQTNQSLVTYSAGQVIAFKRTRTGNSLKDYKGKIKRHENATTGLEGDSQDADVTPVKFRVSWVYSPNKSITRKVDGGGDYHVVNGVGSITNPTVPSMSSNAALQGARAKFFKKLRAMDVQMSGPTFLGELRETARMLRKPALGIFQRSQGYLRKLEREKRSRPKEWMKDIGGLWLEQSFGWAPLLHDAQDAVKAWNRLSIERTSGPISAGFSDLEDMSSSLPSPFNTANSNTFTSPYLRWWIKAKKIEQVQVRLKGLIAARADMTPWDKMALFGFTPSEFVPTVWELLPYSFLVDYFTNIGDILTSAVTDTRWVSYLNMTVRRLSQVSGALVFDQEGTDAQNVDWKITDKSISGGAFKFNNRRVTRTNDVPVALPQLTFNLDLGMGQKANIAALLSQASALHPQKPIRNWHR